MVAYERICLESRPDWIVVVGDVNSTMAAALVAAKLCIPLAHLEAGLRSGEGNKSPGNPTWPRELRALIEQGEEALRLGFEVEAFGAQTVALRTVPALLADRDPAALLRSLADEFAEGVGGLADESLVRSLAPADRTFATLACHSARRKGDILGPEEQRALLDALDAIPWAPTCPHGRPVAVPVELAEIERRFGRR